MPLFFAQGQDDSCSCACVYLRRQERYRRAEKNCAEWKNQLRFSEIIHSILN